MSNDSQLFSIVVAGAMNPSIHHPMWYRLVNLIDDSEAEEAIQSKATFCIPPVAQIEFTKFKIICQETRWEAQTKSIDMVDRLRTLAATVFDEILKHTHISAFGLNCGCVRQTSHQDVGLVLADAIAGAGLGLSRDNLSSSDVVLRRMFSDGHTMTTSLRAGNPPSLLSIDSNFHYPLAAEGPGFITLRERFQERLPIDQTEASSQADSIVTAFEQRLVK